MWLSFTKLNILNYLIFKKIKSRHGFYNLQKWESETNEASASDPLPCTDPSDVVKINGVNSKSLNITILNTLKSYSSFMKEIW